MLLDLVLIAPVTTCAFTTVLECVFACCREGARGCAHPLLLEGSAVQVCVVTLT